jgi:putative cell wall-binding protein
VKRCRFLVAFIGALTVALSVPLAGASPALAAVPAPRHIAAHAGAIVRSGTTRIEASASPSRANGQRHITEPLRRRAVGSAGHAAIPDATVPPEATVESGPPQVSVQAGNLGPADGWYGCGGTPCYGAPRTSFASGPADELLATDDDLELIDPTDGTRIADAALYFFFNEDANQILDGEPHVMYANGHWYASEISSDCANTRVYVAVSQGSDPLQAWSLYSLDIPDTLALPVSMGYEDGLLLGLDEYAVVDAATCSFGAYNGAAAAEFDLADLETAASTVHTTTTSPDPTLFSFAMPDGGPDAIVEIPKTGVGDVGVATVSGTTAGATFSVTVTDITAAAPNVPALVPPPTLPALGSPAEPTLDERPTGASAAGGELAFAATVSCTPSGDATPRACVRVTELLDTGGTWSITQDFILDRVGYDTFSPGVAVRAVEEPHLAIVYSQAASSAGAPIDLDASIQPFTDLADQIQPAAVLVRGQAAYQGQFWETGASVAQCTACGSDEVVEAGVFADARGDWTVDASTVGYGPNPPQGSVADVTPAAPNDPYRFGFGSESAVSGATQIMVSNDPTTSGGVLTLGRILPVGAGTDLVWSLADAATGGSLAAGTRTVYYQFGDGVGTWGPVYPLSVSVTLPATVSRLSGADRYATAARVSNQDAVVRNYGQSVVYVASGANFPDALAGAAAAGVHGAPLLLVGTNTIPTATATELTRLEPDVIIVLGGTASISSATLNQLTYYVGRAVYRIGGTDRYDTATLVSETNFSPGVPVAYVASGRNFPDALGGAASAGVLGGPVLLVPGTTVPSEVAAELARLAPQKIVILGGTASVSSGVATQLLTFVGGDPGREVRWFGPDRYATAAAISANTFPSGRPPVVYVADGQNFPDALSGAPTAGYQGAPLLLVTPTSIPAATAAELLRLHPYRIVILGGTASVSAAVASQLASYAGP